jgi:transposase
LPLINLMNEVQLGYDVLQMDETSVQVLKEDGRPAQSQSRMWVRRGGPAGKTVILFDYDPSRAGIVAARLLEGFKGYLQTDGYEAYAKVAACEGLVHVACLAHARRKFDEAAKANLKAGSGGLAVEGLALIQRIYRIERIAREAGMGAEQRHRQRNKSARPIWEEMRRWLDRSLGTVPPQMLTGKALGYLDAQWTRLVRVLDDGRLEVDTNLCENAIRPFVLGRKAWLFSATPAGAESSARLYSLIETAKSAGCEPYAYLAHVFAELPKAITLADIEALLPWNFTATATQSVAA